MPDTKVNILVTGRLFRFDVSINLLRTNGPQTPLPSSQLFHFALSNSKLSHSSISFFSSSQFHFVFQNYSFTFCFSLPLFPFLPLYHFLFLCLPVTLATDLGLTFPLFFLFRPSISLFLPFPLVSLPLSLLCLSFPSFLLVSLSVTRVNSYITDGRGLAGKARDEIL